MDHLGENHRNGVEKIKNLNYNVSGNKSARWSKPIRSGECLTKNGRSTLTRGRTAIFYVYSSEWQ